MAMPSCRSASRRSRRPVETVAPRLILMVKEPRAGRVKTRLARDLGAASAAALYRSMMNGTAARVSSSRRWQALLAVTPDWAIASPMFPPSLVRLAQGGGDLGARMARAMMRAPPGPVIVIGTDIPALSGEMISRAFRALGNHHAVLGPAGDGGFWLVGFRHRKHAVRAFAAVPWSATDTLAATLGNLKGLKVALIDRLDDVDDASDLKRQRPAIGRLIAAKV